MVGTQQKDIKINLKRNPYKMEKEEHNSQQINKEHLYVTFLLTYIIEHWKQYVVCSELVAKLFSIISWE